MKPVTLAALAVLFAWPVAADPVCLPRADVETVLRETYDETRQSIAFDVRGVIVTTWASPAGSWTVTTTDPAGLSCVIASGTDFTRLDEPAGEAM